MNGFTFYICFGKYGGWRCSFDGPTIRIVLGWMAIVIALRDVEQAIQTLMTAAQDNDLLKAKTPPEQSDSGDTKQPSRSDCYSIPGDEESW